MKIHRVSKSITDFLNASWIQCILKMPFASVRMFLYKTQNKYKINTKKEKTVLSTFTVRQSGLLLRCGGPQHIDGTILW